MASPGHNELNHVSMKYVEVKIMYSNYLINILCILTYWGRVTHICVGNLTIIGPDNGLSPGRRQAITWTNVGILLIGPLGTNFSEMLIEIHTFSFKKIHLKMSGKWRPFCLGLNVLRKTIHSHRIYTHKLRTNMTTHYLIKEENRIMYVLQHWFCFLNNGLNMLPWTLFTCYTKDNQQGCFRLSNWFSLRRLGPWMNHLPPAW